MDTLSETNNVKRTRCSKGWTYAHLGTLVESRESSAYQKSARSLLSVTRKAAQGAGSAGKCCGACQAWGRNGRRLWRGDWSIFFSGSKQSLAQGRAPSRPARQRGWPARPCSANATFTFHFHVHFLQQRTRARSTAKHLFSTIPNDQRYCGTPTTDR